MKCAQFIQHMRTKQDVQSFPNVSVHFVLPCAPCYTPKDFISAVSIYASFFLSLFVVAQISDPCVSIGTAIAL